MAATEENMKILITGAQGQLGRSLQDVFRSRGLNCLAFTRKELDITNLSQVREIIFKAKADVIVNAAAYTNVEQAEIDTLNAFSINELGACNLAIVASECNSSLIHFSTDYVFSGLRNTPWKVDSETKPLSVYGKSKLAGERIIERENPENSVIIRTSWLYSPHGKNFFKTILRRAIRENGSISVVDDQLGQPTNARDLAFQVACIIENRIQGGIFHITNSGIASWFDFAVEIFKLNGSDIDRVRPISSSEFKNKAERPSYSALDNSKIIESSLIAMPAWQDSVKRSFPDIKKAVMEEILYED